MNQWLKIGFYFIVIDLFVSCTMLVVIIIEKVGWYLGNHLLKQKLCNFYLNAYLFSQEGTVVNSNVHR